MLLMFMFIAAEGLSCPNFTCSGEPHSYQQCIYSSKNSINLTPCTDPIIPYCQPSLSNTLCSTVPPASLFKTSWPGENCTLDLNCVYGVCYQSVCNAQNYGDSCLINDQCNPGLYCNNKICDFQIEIGQSGCVWDYDCVNGAGCNSGICTQYFSLSPGTQIDSCVGNNNQLCQYLTCANAILNNNTGFFCTSQLNSFTMNCNNDGDCLSNNDPILNTTLNSVCKCSYGNSGSFCTQLPGDYEYSLYISNLTQWANDIANRMCNTVRRFSSQCISLYWDSLSSKNLLLNQLFVMYYPQIKDNQDCTKLIYFQPYWQLKNGNTPQPVSFAEYLSSVLLILLSLA